MMPILVLDLPLVISILTLGKSQKPFLKLQFPHLLNGESILKAVNSYSYSYFCCLLRFESVSAFLLTILSQTENKHKRPCEEQNVVSGLL